jgi:hypothetical protein
MIRVLEKAGERLLGRVLPTESAQAAPCCGGGCGWVYRCNQSTTWYQRRYCCFTCACTTSNCGSWQNYLRGC